MRRDVLGDARFRIQSCNARPLTTSCSSLFFSQGIETPGSGASEGQIEKHEAEQDREIAAIEDGQEAPWRMSEEIGKRHLARENESNGAGEQAQYHQGAANELERSGKTVERKQRHILERRHGRKFQQLCHSILQKQQAGHDAHQAQDTRLPGYVGFNPIHR
jgi:hypothetical protein